MNSLLKRKNWRTGRLSRASYRKCCMGSAAQEVLAGFLTPIACCSKYLRNPHVAFQRNKYGPAGLILSLTPKHLQKDVLLTLQAGAPPARPKKPTWWTGWYSQKLTGIKGFSCHKRKTYEKKNTNQQRELSPTLSHLSVVHSWQCLGQNPGPLTCLLKYSASDVSEVHHNSGFCVGLVHFLFCFCFAILCLLLCSVWFSR